MVRVEAAALRIQGTWRRIQGTYELHVRHMAQQAFLENQRQEGATLIQSTYRRHVAYNFVFSLRVDFLAVAEATEHIIQSTEISHALYLEQLEALALSCQRLGRGFTARQYYKQRYEETKMATTRIQCLQRCRLAHRDRSARIVERDRIAKHRNASTTHIQRMYRGRVGRRHATACKEEYIATCIRNNSAARVIQCRCLMTIILLSLSLIFLHIRSRKKYAIRVVCAFRNVVKSIQNERLRQLHKTSQLYDDVHKIISKRANEIILVEARELNHYSQLSNIAFNAETIAATHIQRLFQGNQGRIKYKARKRVYLSHFLKG